MDSLLKLTAPPENPKETGSTKSWEKIEARLGHQLPPDYITFIEHYGTGSFDDFIIIYNPLAQNEYHNLVFALDTLHQADKQIQLMGNCGWTVVQPFELYPATEGLLPWGCTPNVGDVFFWQFKGAPETWETIFYNLGSGEYEVWKYSLTEFLYRLLSRQIDSVLLPVDYPSTENPPLFIPVIG